MNRFMSACLLVFLISSLVYSTYSFSQGRFLEGMSVFPALVACYFFVMIWQRKKDDE